MDTSDLAAAAVDMLHAWRYTLRVEPKGFTVEAVNVGRLATVQGPIREIGRCTITTLIEGTDRVYLTIQPNHPCVPWRSYIVGADLATAFAVMLGAR